MTVSGTKPKIASLRGLRILLVEDEMMVAMLEEDMLEMLGCKLVGSAASIAQALVLISTEEIDGAVLDVNLAGHSIYPVADELARLGIPFIFVTGYGNQELEGDYNDRPRLPKPFRRTELQRIMLETFVAEPD